MALRNSIEYLHHAEQHVLGFDRRHQHGLAAEAALQIVGLVEAQVGVDGGEFVGIVYIVNAQGFLAEPHITGDGGGGQGNADFLELVAALVLGDQFRIGAGALVDGYAFSIEQGQQVLFDFRHDIVEAFRFLDALDKRIELDLKLKLALELLRVGLPLCFVSHAIHTRLRLVLQQRKSRGVVLLSRVRAPLRRSGPGDFLRIICNGGKRRGHTPGYEP